MRIHRTHEFIAPWSTGAPVLDAGRLAAVRIEPVLRLPVRLDQRLQPGLVRIVQLCLQPLQLRPGLLQLALGTS